MYAFPVPYLKVLLYNTDSRPLVGQDCQGQRGNVIFHLHMCKAEGVERLANLQESTGILNRVCWKL